MSRRYETTGIEIPRRDSAAYQRAYRAARPDYVEQNRRRNRLRERARVILARRHGAEYMEILRSLEEE